MHHQTGTMKIFQPQNEKTEIKNSSQIYNLDPYIDENGIIRVGGRLDKSNVNNEYKHVIVFLKGSPISKLIISWFYKKNWPRR